MIVQESDILLAALDRRLQVERTLPLAPFTSTGAPPEETGTLVAGTRSEAVAAAAAARGVAASDQSSLAARLPLGRVVDAHVLALSEDGQVTAEIERWRVALAWPSAGGTMPRPGDDVRLRVLAHEPMLLFQNVDELPGKTDDPSIRWSREALELAQQDLGRSASEGARRFTEPILDVEEPGASPRETAGRTAASGDVIGIDDIVVGRTLFDADPARSAGGVDVAAAPATNTPANAVTPVVLQGPAWVGQPMELLVRRERSDEEFDNPALDHWRGDIWIDLPNLGRVAGHLSLSMQGLRLRLEGDDATAVSVMTDASSELAAALGESSVRVQALSVGRLNPGLLGADDR